MGSGAVVHRAMWEEKGRKFLPAWWIQKGDPRKLWKAPWAVVTSTRMWIMLSFCDLKWQRVNWEGCNSGFFSSSSHFSQIGFLRISPIESLNQACLRDCYSPFHRGCALHGLLSNSSPGWASRAFFLSLYHNVLFSNVCSSIQPFSLNKRTMWYVKIA